MPHPVLVSFRPRRVGQNDTGTEARRQVERLWLALPAVVGTVALLLATRKGAYASPDSAFYVGVARNLLDGEGLVAPPGGMPLSHFPPLFPLLLAVVAKITGADPLDAASVINPLLLGSTALLMAAVVYRATKSLLAAVLVSMAAIVSLDLLVYHGSALSEPLFLLLALGCLVAIGRYLESDENRWLAAAAGLGAAATLTRYTGAALIVTGAIALLLRARSDADPGRREVVVRIGTFCAAAGAPAAAWMLWAGSGDRALSFHPPGGEFLLGAARSVSAWVLPRQLDWPARGFAAALVVAAVAGAVAVMISGARGEMRFSPLLPVLGAFAAAYLVMVVFTRTFLDASGDLDLRLLLPLHLVAILAVTLVLVSFWPARASQNDTRTGWARVGTATLVVAVLASQGVVAAAWIVDGVDDDSVARRGLTSAAWTGSDVLAAVSALPRDVDVYSNAPDAIYLLTGRGARALPPTADYLTGDANLDYAAAMQALKGAIHDHRAALAWFDAATWRQEYLATEHQTISALDLSVQPALDDAVGRLYR